MNLKRVARGSAFARAARLAAAGILLFNCIQIGLSAPQSKGAAKLAIATKSLPNATVGVEYYAVIAATGGEAPYDFSGAGLPQGLAFHPASDTIGGKATTAGTYSVVITARDSTFPAEQSASVTFKLVVVAAK
ncbi:MAG TPA: Ig domain-containing protein [Bryobacteraceae bacterium]|nr:Ig domain-containing protein [Bryobacteraceae bacterium]